MSSGDEGNVFKVMAVFEESENVFDLVSHVVEKGLNESMESGGVVELHFVRVFELKRFEPKGERRYSETEKFLERVENFAAERVEEGRKGLEGVGEILIKTAIIGEDRFLFNPRDYGRMIRMYEVDNSVDKIVLDPGYRPGWCGSYLVSFEEELERMGLEVECPSLEMRGRLGELVWGGEWRELVTVFGISFLFYLLLSDFGGFQDFVTGLATSVVVAFVFYRIIMPGVPGFSELGRTSLRFLVFLPLLIGEITKANLEVAYVVLHPELPIDPEIVDFNASVCGDLAVTTLANSITLTPGTITVEVTEDVFKVHTLTNKARKGLFSGYLDRMVHFVYFGPGPRVLAHFFKRKVLKWFER